MPKVKADQFEGPKKFRSGFFIYSDEERSKVMAELRSKHGAEFKISMVASELGKRWKEVDAGKKAKLSEQSAEEKKVYEAAMEKWKQSDSYQQFARSKANETQKKANKANAKEAKESGMPKKCPSPYMAFAMEVTNSIIEKLKAEGKPCDMKTRSVLIKEQWDALSAEDKAAREVKFKEAQAKYKVDHAAWCETEAGKKFLDVKKKASTKAADAKKDAKKLATAAKKSERKSNTSSQPAKKRKLADGSAEPQPEVSPEEAASSPVESESSPVESVESPDE